MSSKRRALLIFAFLVLVLGYVWKPYWQPFWPGAGPLPGTNAVSAVRMAPDPVTGGWMVTVEYFYTGAPKGAILMMELTPAGTAPEQPSEPRMAYQWIPLEAGRHTVTIDLSRPVVREAFSTTHVAATMRFGPKVLASRQIAQAIDWPDSATWYENRRLQESRSIRT